MYIYKKNINSKKGKSDMSKQSAITRSKPTKETQEAVKQAQSQQYRHQSYI